MNKLKLKDTTEIELLTGADLSRLTTLCTDWNTFAALMPKFTEENLSSVELLTDTGLVNGTYSDLVMEPGTYAVKNGGICVGITLREKTEIEKEIEALKSSQEVQDQTITELVNATA